MRIELMSYIDANIDMYSVFYMKTRFTDPFHVLFTWLAAFSLGLLVPFPGMAGQPVTDSLLDALKKADTDAGKSAVYVSLSQDAMARDFKQALAYAQEALHAAERDGGHPLLMKAHKQTASVFYYTGLYEQAILHFDRTVEEALKAGDEVEAINNRVNTSLIHMALGSFKKSIVSLEEAKPRLAEAYAKSERAFPAAERISIYLNLGLAYMADSQYVKARGSLDTGIALARSTPDQQVSLGKLLVARASLMVREGAAAAALPLLQEADGLLEKAGGASLSMHVNKAMAEVYEKTGEDADALSVAGEGLRKAEAVGSLTMKKTFADLLYDIHRKGGRSDSAVRYLDIVKECERKMEADKYREQLVRKDLMKEFEDRERRIREMEGTNERSFWYGLAGFSLLGAASVAGVAVYRRRYRRANLLRLKNELEARQLELEKQRLTAELGKKDAELSRIGYELKKNSLIEGLVGQLEANMGLLGTDDDSGGEGGRKSSASGTRSRAWEEFEYRFQQIHSGFYDRLSHKFPDLTMNERRLCAFLKLDMSTKEISDITGQSIRAINMGRIRLRRKLGLTNTEREIYEFLSGL